MSIIDLEYNKETLICTFSTDILPIGYFSKFDKQKLILRCKEEKYKNAISILGEKSPFFVTIDWSKVSMNAAQEMFSFEVIYNYELAFADTVKVTYPLEDPIMEVEVQPKTIEWGTPGGCCQILIRPKDANKKAWMFKQTTVAVNICKDKPFIPYTGSYEYCIGALDTFSVPLKYDYAGQTLKSNKEETIYVKINEVKKGVNVKFTPLAPTIRVEWKKLVNEYVLGSGDKELFEITAIKKNILAQDLLNLKYFCSSESAIKGKMVDDRCIIEAKGNNLKTLPSNDIMFRVKANADNAINASEIYLHLTPHDVTENNMITLRQIALLEIELIEPIKLYKGSHIYTHFIIIKNNVNIAVTNIQLSLSNTHNTVTFKNGNLREEISYISPLKTEKTPIYISSKEVGETDCTLTIEADYTSSVMHTFNIQIKNNILPELCITPLAIPGSSPIYMEKEYNGECCQVQITIKNSDDYPSEAFLPLTVDDIHIENSSFSIKPIEDETVILPHQPKICGIHLNGNITQNEVDLIQEGQEEPYMLPLSYTYKNREGSFSLPVYKRVYQGYKVGKPFPLKMTFPLLGESRKVVATQLKVTDFDHDAPFIKTGQKRRVLPPFFFINEAGKAVQEMPITHEGTLKIYLDIDACSDFNEKVFIETPKKLCLTVIRTSEEPIENKMKEYTLEIFPAEVNAQPMFEFEPAAEDEYDKEAKILKVNYTLDETNGEKRFLGNFTIKNAVDVAYNGESVTYDNAVLWLGRRNKEQEWHGGYDEEKLGTIEIKNGGPIYTCPVYLDWNKWKKNLSRSHKMTIRFQYGQEQREAYEIKVRLACEYDDDVYALDLGTTGIVVAKMHNLDVTLVPLHDQEEGECIEKDKNILSSISILKVNEKESLIELAPAIGDYKKGKYPVLVPAKFIIGQRRIPFLQSFYDNDSFSKQNVEAFGQGKVDLTIKADQQNNEKTIDHLIGNLYKDILGRIGKEASNIRKLVVTYPNTYTPKNISCIEKVLKEQLGLTDKGQICFVPESDAVAAYFFDQLIYKGEGFTNSSQNIIFYDMGAGTLDVSLVEFVKKENNITAKIQSKIGIPIAGNYLDYILYECLEPYITKEGKTEKGQIYIKQEILELKKSFMMEWEQQTINKENFVNIQKYVDVERLNDKTYKEVFGKAMVNYLNTCVDTIFHILLGKKQADAIVFSGRASQFAPLKQQVKEYKKKNIQENKLENVIGIDVAKTCVAIGALKYQDYFNGNTMYRIENKNQYAKIGIVYFANRGDGKFGVVFQELINPSKETWDDAECINGTWCKEFRFMGTITRPMANSHIYYIQTFLDTDEIEKLYAPVYRNELTMFDDLRWGFINVLYTQRVGRNVPELTIELVITKENDIQQRRIGDNYLPDDKIIERIEDNILYKKSLWPHININFTKLENDN